MVVVVPDRSFILGVEVKRDPRNNSSFNNGAQLKTVWRERERERKRESHYKKLSPIYVPICVRRVSSIELYLFPLPQKPETAVEDSNLDV